MYLDVSFDIFDIWQTFCFCWESSCQLGDFQELVENLQRVPADKVREPWEQHSPKLHPKQGFDMVQRQDDKANHISYLLLITYYLLLIILIILI